jgi:hypothetical protein
MTIQSMTGDYRTSASLLNGSGNHKFEVNADNIHLLGLETHGLRAFPTGSRSNIEFINCTFQDSNAGDFFESTSSATLIKDVVFYGNEFKNIGTRGSDTLNGIVYYYAGSTNVNWLVSDNTFDTISWNGLAINGAGGFTIKNNVFKNTCDNGIQIHYFSVNSPTGSVVISKNTFDNNRSTGCISGAMGDGLGISAIAGASANVPIQITDNSFVNNERALRFHDNYSVCNLTGKSVSITSNSFAVNNSVGVYQDCVGQLNISDNYWGSLTGPTLAGHPTGTGAIVHIEPAATGGDPVTGTLSGPGTILLLTYRQYAP